jgi:hypothetical protein
VATDDLAAGRLATKLLRCLFSVLHLSVLVGSAKPLDRAMKWCVNARCLSQKALDLLADIAKWPKGLLVLGGLLALGGFGVPGLIIVLNQPVLDFA